MKSSVEQTDKLNIITSVLLKWLQPKRIWLFGSRSSGENKPWSDFDIAIEEHRGDFRSFRKAREELDLKLGIHSADVIDLDNADPEFKILIYEKGEMIYERN